MEALPKRSLCPACQELKPFPDSFHLKGKQGHESHCKDCINSKKRARRKKIHEEKVANGSIKPKVQIHSQVIGQPSQESITGFSRIFGGSIAHLIEKGWLS